MRELNYLAALAELQPTWSDLLARTPRANYFQSLDWLTVFWRHYGADCRLRVLVVQSGGDTVGILPLSVRSERTQVGRLRVLNYPLHDWGTFYGPIGPDPALTLAAGLEHVRRTPRDWDLLDLRWVDASDDYVQHAFQATGYTFYRNRWAECAQVDLAAAGSWDAYWADRTSKWRTNVRRNERRLAEMGQVRYRRYRPLGAVHGESDPRWDLYDACEAVAGQSWQAGSRTGTTITHDAVRLFLRDAHEAAARAGGVDMNLLYVNDAPVAFNYCYQYQGNVFGLRMGFDRTSGAEGAGSVLLHRMIQDSFVRGDRLFDMGSEYLECKRLWLTQTVKSERYSHYPTGFSRVRLIEAKRWLERRFGMIKQP